VHGLFEIDLRHLLVDSLLLLGSEDFGLGACVISNTLIGSDYPSIGVFFSFSFRDCRFILGFLFLSQMRRGQLARLLRVDGRTICQQSALQRLALHYAEVLLLCDRFLANIILLDGSVVASFSDAKSNAAEAGGSDRFYAGWLDSWQHVVEHRTLVDLSCFETIVDSVGASSIVMLVEHVFDG